MKVALFIVLLVIAGCAKEVVLVDSRMQKAHSHGPGFFIH